jgi:hypothetical protein
MTAIKLRDYAARQSAHVIMFSTGVGSYLAAHRVIEQYGREGVVLLFTDTRGTNPSEHAGEDADNYRFMREAVADLGVPLVHLQGDEDVWGVFRRRRRIGSSWVANCSTELKQRPAQGWLADHCPDPAATTVHIGIDWSEAHRIPAVERAYAPRPVSFPMTRSPYLDKPAMLRACQGRGVEPPRLYRAGFSHANCGGFCVRAGHAQFALLLREIPDRYAYHEAREQELRAYLGVDVAILRDRTGGSTRPLTLREFRERIEARQPFDQDDWGGCGCFTVPDGDGL